MTISIWWNPGRSALWRYRRSVGASTTALYYTSLKIVRGEDHSLARMFFKSFRENFRQSTVLLTTAKNMAKWTANTRMVQNK